MINSHALACLAAGLLWTGAASAATSVNDDFDAGIGTWVGNTSETTVFFQPFNGNPGGFLATDSGLDSVFGVTGAQNKAAAYTGIYAPGVWGISFDLNYGENISLDSSWLRFRYQDATFNGWHYVVDTAPLPDSLWHPYSVSFDTRWDDATAEANGWVQEAFSPNFSTLWTDVYSAEVRLPGSGALGVGIDNYAATAPAAVPLPAAGALLAASLGAAGLLRRRRV